MKRKTMLLLCTTLLLITSTLFYQPLIGYLTRQAATPEGLVGKIMTRIWSDYFTDLHEWGFHQITLDDYDTILDIGFGGGSGIRYITDQNDRHIVYGIDISKEALATASQLNQAAINESRVFLKTGDVAALPFAPTSFDLIIAVQTHIYWDELVIGLGECYRTLNQDGVLLITCEKDKIEYHLPEYQQSEDFTRLLYETGFRDVQVRTQDPYIAYLCTK